MIEFSRGYELAHSEIAPGSVIGFERLEDIRLFEDEVAYLLKPEFDPRVWNERYDIVSAWRVDGFFGRLLDVQLVSLKNAYEELLHTGSMHPSSGMNGFKVDGPDRKFFDETTIGFDYSAFANGVPVTARMFFVPLPRGRRKVKREPTIEELRAMETDNMYGHFYDAERGEVVYNFAVDTSRTRKTIRRPISIPKYDKRELKSASRSVSTYGGTGVSAGSNPSVNYNSF